MSIVIQEGFQAVRQVLSADDIDAVRAAIEETIDRVARVMLTPLDRSFPGAPIEERLERAARRDRAYASALLQVVLADAQHDPRIAGIAEHPGISRAIRDLLRPDEATGHVVQTRAAIPAFERQISPWHQDVIRPAENTGCASVRLAAWIPLADVDERTGALEVMPGAWEAPLPHQTDGNGHFFIPETELPARDRHVVPMQAGDALLLDRYVPHRARPTRGLQGRWSVVMWVKAEGGAGC